MQNRAASQDVVLVSERAVTFCEKGCSRAPVAAGDSIAVPKVLDSLPSRFPRASRCFVYCFAAQ